MNEQQIRTLIQQELQNRQPQSPGGNPSMYQSGTPQILVHAHTGIDSPKINEENIIPRTVFSGSITMSQGTITGTYPNQVITWANYLIPVSSNPVSVRFYGGALNTTASPAIHAYITGEASLATGYQYQPNTPNSVLIGNIKQTITQGSGALIVTNGTTAIIRSSQSYIAFASDASNNIYAVARVYAYNNSNLIIQTAVATNWSLSGEWIVT